MPQFILYTKVNCRLSISFHTLDRCDLLISSRTLTAYMSMLLGENTLKEKPEKKLYYNNISLLLQILKSNSVFKFGPLAASSHTIKHSWGELN